MEKENKKIEDLRKRIGERKRRKFRILFFILFSGIIIYGVFFIKKKTLNYLWNLETFKIKEIKISPPDAIPLITQIIEIEKDKNLLFLKSDELREKINSINEIEDCKIIKSFPSTLEIEVKLRNPWAILKTEKGEFVIDREGVIIDRPFLNAELEIYGIKVNQEGNKIEEIYKIEILKEIDRWYNYFNIGNLFKWKRIDISNLNKIEISDGERKIYFTKENTKGKMERLLFVLKNLKGDFEYIDTRFKDFYVKFKSDGKSNHSN